MCEIDLINLLMDISSKKEERIFESPTLTKLGYICQVNQNKSLTFLLYVNEKQKKLIAINHCLNKDLLKENIINFLIYLNKRDQETENMLEFIKNTYSDYKKLYIGYSLGSHLFNISLNTNNFDINKDKFVTFSGIFIQKPKLKITNYIASSDWYIDLLNKISIENYKDNNMITTIELKSKTNFIKEIIDSNSLKDAMINIHVVKCIEEYPLIEF